MKLFEKKYFINFILLLLNICVTNSDGSIITSASYIFETFSPYQMIRFFEFSDKGWDISENCLKDMYNYLEGLRKTSQWAIKLYDATSYYNGGAFGGNRLRLQNANLCRNLQSEYEDMLYTHWNLRINTTVVPFPVHVVVGKYNIEMVTNIYQRQQIQQLICFPKSCQPKDLTQILEISLFQSNHIVKNMTLDDFRILSEEFSIFDDSNFYILCSLIITTMIIFTSAHFYNNYSTPPLDSNEIDNDRWDKIPIRTENKNYSCNINMPSTDSNKDSGIIIDKIPKVNGIGINIDQYKLHPANNFNENHQTNNNSKSKTAGKSHRRVSLVTNRCKTTKSRTLTLDIITSNNDLDLAKKTAKNMEESLYKCVLKAFSLTTITKTLTENGPFEKEIAVLEGLKVFCSFAMIFSNTFVVMNFISNNHNADNRYSFNILAFLQNQTTFLVDLFFFISGANLTHLFFKDSRKGSWNVFEQLLHFVAMIAHKICSLILPYAIILICLELSSKYFYYNTALEIPSFDYRNCDHNKWRNVLFIESFFEIEDRCMPWTWFISLEVHFYFAACLILLLAQIHPKYAGIICSTLFVTSIIASTVLEMDPPSYLVFQLNTVNKDIVDFNMIFDKIWLRISPYLLGMCLGYILHKTKGKFDMNIFIIIFGWIACFLIFAGFVFGFQLILLRANPWIKATIITLGHTIWSMIIFWIVLASISQYGGFLRSILVSKKFNSLGKLSNCTFLLGPLVIRTVLLAGETGIFMSNGYFFIMSMGFVILTYAGAFILHIFFEAPLMTILEIIYKRNL